MKRIKWIFVILLALVTALHWISLTDIERTLAPWVLRKSVLYYTGIMSFFAMTVAVILALRLRITLFYSARNSDHALIASVKNLTQQADVPLHLSISGKNPPLTAQAICQNVPDFRHHTVWFCGSSGFGAAIKRGLSKEGLPGRRFHQELFEMR